MCNGIFSIPKVPSLPGKEDFIASGGQVMHSTDFQNSYVLEGKQVIVVGFGKSATDIATLAVPLASECTLVFRQIPWKVPRFFLGLVNIKYILLTPFAEAWLPYRKLRGIERFLHTFGKPLVWAFWRINEMLLRLQFGLDACRMLPDKPLNKWVVSTIGLESKGLYKYIRSGRIQVRKTQIKGFASKGIELENGDRVQADVVIFATGFQQDISFLEEKYRKLVIDDLNNFHLYRNLIHPDIPQLGFVGYNSSKFCPLTSDIGAQWLVEYVKGNLVLPSHQKMLEEMEAEWHWKQIEWESGLVNGASVFPFSFHYIDELINDMGVRSYKKGWKRIKEIMMPIDPSAYKNLRQELLPKKYLSLK